MKRRPEPSHPAPLTFICLTIFPEHSFACMKPIQSTKSRYSCRSARLGRLMIARCASTLCQLVAVTESRGFSSMGFTTQPTSPRPGGNTFWCLTPQRPYPRPAIRSYAHWQLECRERGRCSSAIGLRTVPPTVVERRVSCDDLF